MRVGIVVPRYGAEINGGAETLARMYGERLAARGHAVTAITTCALDYREWADHFPPGESEEGGVRVLRFPVPEPRDGRSFDRYCDAIPAQPDLAWQREWMRRQGPNSPELLEHLRAHGRDYDVVCFIPYLYPTTVDGLPLVADRSVLIPAFHDEPWLRLGIFDPVVASARALVFSTPEEQSLAEGRFPDVGPRAHLVGAAIDEVPDADPDRARAELKLPAHYVVAVGRIEPAKGSQTLLAHHGRYRRLHRSRPDLVMLGRVGMRLPRRRWLHTPGFVSETQKHDVIAGALALVTGSPFESLSLVLFDAWQNGVPTVALAHSPVIIAQTERSGAGLLFRNAAEYAGCLETLRTDPARRASLGDAGRSYAAGQEWGAVMDRLEQVLDDVRAVEPGA